MKLYEYQAKTLFQKSGIATPTGHLITDIAQVTALAHALTFPVMVKGQVLAGGRAKHEGIKIAHTFEEVQSMVANLLNTSIDGLTISSVLIEDKIESNIHYYVSVVNDRTARKPVLVASVEYGGEIEEIAKQYPNHISKQYIDPLTGLHPYQSRQIADDLNFPKWLWQKFDELAQALYRCYLHYDATLVEINPVAYTEEHGFIALDAKIKVDDNALYRQADILAWQQALIMTEAENLALQSGVSYVKLNGQIGCVVNGAALAMTIMDMTSLYGDDHIAPACFLDIGGGADAVRVVNALKIVFSDSNVKAVICSIFGGMTRCDEIATGIVQAYELLNPHIKTIVRLQGTNALLGWEIIQNAKTPNLQMAVSLSEAVNLAIATVKEG
ncbi:MAG: ADP-forming succinate--CoA ligase subunit beta [Phototrophicales bacterium]|nr:ADP-forming succinate--CoA ligase subunit beta [Phototrophicales bacterium]